MTSELSFAVNLDLFMDRNFDRNFKGIDNALARTADKVRSLNDTAQKMNGLASMADKCQKLTASTGETQSKLDALKTRTADLDGYISRNAENTARLSSRYQALKAEADRLASSGQKNSTMYQRVAQRMKQVKVELKGSRDEGKRLSDIQKGLNSEASKLERSLNSDTEALNRMKAELQGAGVNTNDLANEQSRLTEQAKKAEQAQQRLADAQSRMKSAKEALSWGNIKGSLFGAAGSIMALKAPVTTMMNFEQAMANVRAVNNASDEDFKALRDQALELGSKTQFSASQAANTQENLARGGFDPQQIMAAMPAVLSMAAAEGMDLAQAGDIVVKTIGGMGLKAEDAGRVADVLANMSASSSTNIAELGEGMKIAAPVMSQLGVNIDQLGAYLGGMANKGFTGSEAGNALASTAMRLSKMPAETEKALKQLGVAIKTRDGKMRELPDIMKALNNAFNKRKMGEAERMDALARIFGQGHGKAMLGFLDAAVKGDMDTLQRSNETQSTGKAEAMSKIRNDTLVGDLTSLGSAWEGFMISVGKPLEAWSRNIVQALTQAISWVTDFMKQHEKIADIAVKIGAVIAGWGVAKSAFNIVSNVGKLTKAFFDVSSATKAANAAMEGVSASGGMFSSLGNMVKSVWGVIMAHPFVAIGAAVAAAAVLIWQNWDKIKEVAAKCWEAITQYAGVAAQWISDKWQAVAAWWDSWTIGDVFGVVKDYAAKAWEWYTWPYTKLSEWLSSFELPDIFASLSDMAKAAIDSIMGLFSGLGTWIMDTIGKLNPFNWEMPSWLGGGAKVTPEQAESGKAATKAKYGTQDLRPSYMRHATGGILTRPHLGLVAEAGAEAIIPLTDRARGREVLLQAANILGVQGFDDEGSSSQSIISLSQSGRNVDDGNYPFGAKFGADNRSYSNNTFGQPQINITVNASGNDNQGLADMVYQKVMQAWNELQEQQQRLAFA